MKCLLNAVFYCGKIKIFEWNCIEYEYEGNALTATECFGAVIIWQDKFWNVSDSKIHHTTYQAG